MDVSGHVYIVVDVQLPVRFDVICGTMLSVNKWNAMAARWISGWGENGGYTVKVLYASVLRCLVCQTAASHSVCLHVQPVYVNILYVHHKCFHPGGTLSPLTD